MTRLLAALTLTFVLCLSASAQLVSSGAGISNSGGGGGGGSYVGPGNAAFSGAAAAFWGLRAFTRSIAGTQKLINIIRASDSHACDVLSAASGGMGNTTSCGTGGDNGQTATSFCTATTCKVVTWYDQSGANECSSSPCNLTQATSANQPQLVFSCLGSLPCVQFVGSSSTYMQSASCGGCPSTATNAAMYVADRNGATSSLGWVLGGGSGFNSYRAYYQSAINTAATGDEAGAATNTASDNAWHSIVGAVGYSSISSSTSVATGGDCGVIVDGSLNSISSGCGTAVFASPYTVGALNGGSPSDFLTADVMEIWFLGNTSGAGFNTTVLTALCHNQFLFYGTTSC